MKKERKVDCGICSGDGYIEEWDESKKVPRWIVSDCSECDGKGTVKIEIIDNRKNSVGNKLDFPKEY